MAPLPVAQTSNPFTVGGASSPSTTSTTGLAITPQGTGGAVGGTLSGNKTGSQLLSAASIQMFRTVPIPNRLSNLFSLHCYKKRHRFQTVKPPPHLDFLFQIMLPNRVFYIIFQ